MIGPPLESMDLPYLTADLPGVAALYKCRPEDFEVEEIAAYAPGGAGDHVFFAVEKRGLTTLDAVRSLARALGVAPRQVGYAGLKDAQGVTRQVLSLEHADPARIESLELPGLRVLWVARHKNKLRIGHLAGNRFGIKLREVEPGGAEAVRAALAVLEARGLPNPFGEQRFGARGDTWQIGRALMRGDAAEAVALILGRPGPRDHGAVRRARELFDAGRFEEAARAWPGSFRDAIRLARAMARGGGKPGRALRALPRPLMRLYTSAWQSFLVNAVLAERISTVDRVLEGDLAWRHQNGAVFLVEDPLAEAPRAARQEISPSGPLFGPRMSWPRGVPAQIERGVLEREGCAVEDFERRGALAWQGGRRPLRVPLRDLELREGADDAGPFLELRFALPPGSYATALLRELLKDRGGACAGPVTGDPRRSRAQPPQGPAGRRESQERG